MNRLKMLRRQKGDKQGDIANLLHITQGAVSQWELGRTNMDYQYAKTLADYFGVTPEYLLGETDIMDSASIQAPAAVRIPVIGAIRAGIPLAAIEDIGRRTSQGRIKHDSGKEPIVYSLYTHFCKKVNHFTS